VNTKTLEDWLDKNAFPIHKGNLDPLAVVSAKPVKPKTGVKEAFEPVDNSDLIERIRKANYHYYSV
jgi:hypothetical protein